MFRRSSAMLWKLVLMYRNGANQSVRAWPHTHTWSGRVVQVLALLAVRTHHDVLTTGSFVLVMLARQHGLFTGGAYSSKS